MTRAPPGASSGGPGGAAARSSRTALARPTSQAFKPTKKDEGLLSVSRGSLTSAEEAFVLHTTQKKLESAGVWTIMVSDCTDAERSVHEDPLTEPVIDKAHAVVDFQGLNDTKAKAVAQRLNAKAACQYVAQATAT